VQLREYIFHHRLKKADCANQLGISPGHLSNLINTEETGKKPSLDLSVKIEKWSNGQVPVSVWSGETA
jgi:hypothetical protein